MGLFNTFFKSKDKQKRQFSYAQAMLIELDFAGFEDFGTKKQQALVRHLEESIERVLPNNAGLDGDEFGEGQVTIYLYGPSANKLFDAVEPLLKKSKFEHIDITLQYGAPDNPKTKDKKFTL